MRSPITVVLAVISVVGCGGGGSSSGNTTTVQCPALEVMCGALCLDPATDRQHCGASGDCTGANEGVACNDGEVCDGGHCALSCQASLVKCDGKCIDPQTDLDHCGASGASCTGGTACGAGSACISGACTPCGASQAACGGHCVDPATSHDHCGASGLCTGADAGTACRADQVCSGGSCACPAGMVACGTSCIDPMADANHCGASGACTGGTAGSACTASQICLQGNCLELQAYDWRPSKATPRFVEDGDTLAHIVFDPSTMQMNDTTHHTSWTMIGSVGSHENGMWLPPLSWSGPYTGSAFWQGDGATKAWLDTNTNGDFTVCALIKPGAHPLYAPNKIIIANGKAEGNGLEVGGWALMQMHQCYCFHYHDDFFSSSSSAHGEWMSPECDYANSADTVGALEWSWECGGRAGTSLGALRDSFTTDATVPNGNQSGEEPTLGDFHASTQPPTIGNYADGSGPLWDGGVYEIIISRLPATAANMWSIVARAQGRGMQVNNDGPVPLRGADGLIHLGGPSSVAVQGDGYVAEDGSFQLTGSIGAAATGGECFGYEVAADDWTALQLWLTPFSITSAAGDATARVYWPDPVSHVLFQLSLAGGGSLGVEGDLPGTFSPGSHHRQLWCFDPGDGKVRGYADGDSSTPFAVSPDGPGLAPADFPDLDDPTTAVRLDFTNPSVKIYRVWACPGSSPSTCW